MSTDARCFLSGEPAAGTLTIPALGWGDAYAKAASVEVAVCSSHANPPADEAAIVAALLDFADKNAPRPNAAMLAEIWPWLDRLAKGIFYQVYEQVWTMPLVLVCNRLGVPAEAKELYQELSEDLKEPIFELFPELGPFKKLDYHFFEVESNNDQDNVLWLRLPGGLVVYAWPGVL